VEGEQRVHGAVERRYRLRRELAAIGRDAAASMPLDEHRHGFAAAMAALPALPELTALPALTGEIRSALVRHRAPSSAAVLLRRSASSVQLAVLESD
jgi:hypothetical protein